MLHFLFLFFFLCTPPCFLSSPQALDEQRVRHSDGKERQDLELRDFQAQEVPIFTVTPSTCSSPYQISWPHPPRGRATDARQPTSSSSFLFSARNHCPPLMATHPPTHPYHPPTRASVGKCRPPLRSAGPGSTPAAVAACCKASWVHPGVRWRPSRRPRGRSRAGASALQRYPNACCHQRPT